MGCTSTRSYGPLPVWSNKKDDEWVFFAFSEALATAGVGKVRASFEMASTTGDTEIRPAYRTANDGVTWGSASPILFGSDSPRGANGTTYASGFVDLTTNLQGKALLQFGVECKNKTSVTTQEIANASLQIDMG